MSGIRINSNVEGVIGVLARFRTGLDEAVVETVKPERWRSALRRAAVLALEDIAAPEQRGMIHEFVDTISLAQRRRGFVADIGRRRMGENLFAEVVAAEHRATVGVEDGVEVERRHRKTDLQGSQSALMEQAREVLRDWVETPESEGGKRKEQWEGGRDEGLSDEDIIGNLSVILFHTTPNQSDEMKSARTNLTRALGKFWARRGGAGVLEQADVDRWLRAVLGAWRELMRRQLPVMLGQQLDELWNSSHERML